MPVPFSTERSRRQLLGLSLIVLFGAAAVWAYSGSLIGDEFVHFYLIDRFRTGDFRTAGVFNDYLTMLPGFHLLVAGLMVASGSESLGAARLINFSFAIATVGIFYLLRRRGSDAKQLTAQFMVLPILQPFFFLVYTDVLSLGLILTATLAMTVGRHWLSAVVLLAAMATRQNNIVWAGLLAAYAVSPLLMKYDIRQWRAVLRIAVPYLVDLCAFIAFWWFNGSISLSHAQAPMHPDAKLHLGNIYYALFLLGLLLPLQLSLGLLDFIRKAAAKPLWISFPIILFGIFWWGFTVDHPYNLIPGDFCLRNNLLKAAIVQPWLRATIGIVATLAACGLTGIRIQPVAARWLYPFSVLFLSACWLIETRYALIPIALWLAFREPSTRAVERATLVYWFAATTCLFFSIIDHGSFL